VVPCSRLLRCLLPRVRGEDAGVAGRATGRAAWRPETAGVPRQQSGGCGMSAAPAVSCVLRDGLAAAAPGGPVWRAKPIEGYAFYRKHTSGLLRRYLRASMEMGRSPCVLGNVVFRGRVSSYRISSFEDVVIFIFDVEKCLKRLDPQSQAVIAHVALEDYTIQETAAMTGESERSVARIYSEALDRLTRSFLDFGLLDPNVENLSREEA
jgi:hypothetical protein